MLTHNLDLEFEICHVLFDLKMFALRYFCTTDASVDKLISVDLTCNVSGRCLKLQRRSQGSSVRLPEEWCVSAVFGAFMVISEG